MTEKRKCPGPVGCGDQGIEWCANCGSGSIGCICWANRYGELEIKRMRELADVRVERDGYRRLAESAVELNKKYQEIVDSVDAEQPADAEIKSTASRHAWRAKETK